ncbi:MAG: hypothetical protein LBR98_03185 [Syntrophomonadaceae bacterium]|jgi:hypothetical protein|nr:hypothetical protein [Syntrophomonadaceae bacterium]
MYLGPIVIGAIACFAYYFLYYRPKQAKKIEALKKAEAEAADYEKKE